MFPEKQRKKANTFLDKQAELEALSRRATELARSIEEEEENYKGGSGGGGADVRFRSAADGRYEKKCELEFCFQSFFWQGGSLRLHPPRRAGR